MSALLFHLKRLHYLVFIEELIEFTKLIPYEVTKGFKLLIATAENSEESCNRHPPQKQFHIGCN